MWATFSSIIQHRNCFPMIICFRYKFPGSTWPFFGGLNQCRTQLQTLQEQVDSLEAQQNTCYQQLTTCNNQLTQEAADLNTCNTTLISFEAEQPELARCYQIASISLCQSDPGCTPCCIPNDLLTVYGI